LAVREPSAAAAAVAAIDDLEIKARAGEAPFV
jgi:hypothetical protein